MVGVEEYVKQMSEVACEYLDGQILERPAGERGHSTVQAALIAYFHSRRKQLGIRVKPEFRMQTAPNRYRVPDVVIETDDGVRERILTRSPLLCIEIESPEDSHSRMIAKVQEYLEFGVGCVWTIDPETETAWVHTRTESGDCLSHVVKEGLLTTPDGRLSVPLAELFVE